MKLEFSVDEAEWIYNVAWAIVDIGSLMDGPAVTVRDKVARAAHDRLCDHCGVRFFRRKSKLCDACEIYNQNFGKLPPRSVLAERAS